MIRPTPSARVSRIVSPLARVADVCRGAFRRPVIAAALVVSLALGTGVAATAFDVLDAALLRPFAFADSSRLVFVWGTDNPAVRRGLSLDDIERWRQADAFDGLALVTPASRMALGQTGAFDVMVAPVQPHLTELLGVPPLLGRPLNDRDLDDGASILLSYRAWRRFFGAAPDVVGTATTLGGAPATVVGVMPPGFFLPDFQDVDVWRALDVRTADRTSTMYWAVARLAPGRTLRDARAEVRARLGAAETPAAPIVGLMPLTRMLVLGYERAVWGLASGAVVLLVIVWINLAVLTAASVDARRRDLTIRTALGGSPARLYGQLLGEHVVLAGLGVMLGALVAWGFGAVVRDLAGAGLPRLAETATGARVYGLLACLALVTAPIVTALAGRSLTSLQPATLLQADAGTGTGAPRRALLRPLVLLELAVVPALLMTASVCLAQAARFAALDWGFQPAGAGVITVGLPQDLWRQLETQTAITERVMSAAMTLPEVEAVSTAYWVPVASGRAGTPPIGLDGRVVEAGRFEERRIGPGHFAALGVPILRGREFTADDHRGSPRVVVLGAAAADVLWPGVDPIGRTLRFVHEPLDVTDMLPAFADALRDVVIEEHAWEVVGVVPDIRTSAWSEPEPALYIDSRQQDDGVFFGSLRPLVVVRAAAPITPRLLQAVAERVQQDVPGVEVASVDALDRLVDRAVGQEGTRAIVTAVSAALSVIALLLTVIGVHALVSELAARRRLELALRLALGASRLHAMRVVLQEVGGLAVAGGVLGAIAAVAAVRFIAPVLSLREPVPLWMWMMTAGVLAGALVLACALPLRRLSATNPATLLRHP